MPNDLRLSEIHQMMDAFVELTDAMEDYLNNPLNVGFVTRLTKARVEANRILNIIQTKYEE